jgi:hypothetical protein
MSTNSNNFLMQCRSQRSQRQGFIISQNKGQNRFSMQCPSPYFTTRELDMRRKAEILQYSKNATNAKSQNKQWAWLATQQKSTVYCEDIYTLQTPTSSSDVPGEVTMLYKDSSVPISRNRNDHFVKFTNVPYPTYKFTWDVKPNTSVSIPNKQQISVASLSFGTNSGPEYSFQSILPICLTANGNLNNNNYNIDVLSMDVHVKAVTLRIYYNDLVLSKISVDISNLDTMTISLLNSNNTSFNASKFIGTLNISPINLSVFPYYFLTMKLEVEISHSTYDEYNNVIINTSNDSVYNVSSNTVANITTDTDPSYYSYKNCTIENPPDSSTFHTFSFTER